MINRSYLVHGLLEKCTGIRPTREGGHFVAQCPAHDDTGFALTLDVVGESSRVRCAAGCREREISAALGLPPGKHLIDATEYERDPADKPAPLSPEEQMENGLATGDGDTLDANSPPDIDAPAQDEGEVASEIAASHLPYNEARELTDRINGTAGDLLGLLLESYERKAWTALGYSSWRKYAAGEFKMSEGRAYQLLSQRRVQGALEEAVSTSVEITEAEARRIKPHLTELTEQVRERVDAGESPGVVLADVKKQALASKRPAARRAPPADGTDFIEPTTSTGPSAGESPGVDTSPARAVATGSPEGSAETQVAVERLTHAVEVLTGPPSCSQLALATREDRAAVEDWRTSVRSIIGALQKFEARLTVVLTTDTETGP